MREFLHIPITCTPLLLLPAYNHLSLQIHGHCLGLQLLLTLISHDEYCLSEVDSHNHASVVAFTPQAKNSALIEGIPREVQSNMEKHNISMHNHGFGLLVPEVRPSILDCFFRCPP